MEVNGFIQVRQHTVLIKSVLKCDGEIIERYQSIRMTWNMEYKSSSMEINCLIQVRRDSLLLKSVLETNGKVVER